ncbi:MAG: phage baseplate assembly protein V [Cyanobacteria bacterium P01_G01_bin.67]
MNNDGTFGSLGYVESFQGSNSSRQGEDTPSVRRRFYGKYRGVVVTNVDPEQRGRLLVQVPDVLGLLTSSWALPCLPNAGIQMGTYMIPPIGAGVWVEFEQGDPDYPIWVGCFWGSVAEVPPLALAGNPASPNILLQTSGQNAILLSDLPGPAGGILLKSASGAASIQITDTGITITNGQASIALIGPTVSINGTALTIT